MIIVNLLGVVLISLIAWWFWLYKPEKTVVSTVKNITVVVNDGVYQPSIVKISANKQTELNFLRKDGSPCADTVIFPEFEISEELPLEKNKLVKLPPMEAGEYSFCCPMQMYNGVLIVK